MLVGATLVSPMRPAAAQAEASTIAEGAATPVEAALAEAVAAAPMDRMPVQERLVGFGVDAIPALRAVLEDDARSPMARRIAAWSLAELEEASACGAVGAAVAADDDLGSRVAFALAQARCGLPDAARALVADTTAEPAARLKVALWLALESDSGIEDDVRSMTQDAAFDGLQSLVTLTLGLLGDTAATSTLEAMRFRVETRPYAAIALLRMGERSAAVDVRLAVEDPDPSLRYAALRALAEGHVEGTLPLLLAASADLNPRIARYATREARLWRRRAAPR